MAKQKKSTAPAAEPKPETGTPEWVYSTPEECEYRLVMYATGGDAPEEVIISRDEFIAAKHCIARMRGYDLNPPEATEDKLSSICVELTLAPEVDDSSAPTASAALRASLIDGLRDRFEDFIERARMHEMFLLDNVLATFYSTSRGADNPDVESMLAEAFTHELGSDHTYVVVSRDQVDAVKAYVAGLETGEGVTEN